MIISSWHRLVEEYRKRMTRLLSANLWDLIKNPDLVKSPKFQASARQVARMMVAEVAAQNEKSWRVAARKSMRSRKIFEALRDEINIKGIAHKLEMIAAQNAQLISSVPAEIAQHISERAAEMQRRGMRSKEIEGEIRKLAPKLTKNRIQLIARTEISKAETDMTRERAEDMGLSFYQWKTAEDSRVRVSHRKMDGVVVAWSDAPNPEVLAGEKSSAAHAYHAGATFQCRCIALPLVSLDEVRWPARVHVSGSLVRMSRAQFKKQFADKIAA